MSEWRTIESAPKDRYIVGAWRDGDRWRFAQVFDQFDEWVNVFSDRVETPTHWCDLPK